MTEKKLSPWDWKAWTNFEAWTEVFPLIPGIIKNSTLHDYGRHPTGSKWDRQTLATVEFYRNSILSPKSSLSKWQQKSLKDRGVPAGVWSAQTKVPKPPEQAIPETVFKAIEQLGSGDETYTKPDVVGFEAEWIGYGRKSDDKEQGPEMLDEVVYKQLMKEKTRTSRTTVLYLHGGMYYMYGPTEYRKMASKLAKASGGRAFLISYRLAPQTAFPGQLIDALNAYLFLLHPLKDSFHEAVSADDIVFVGDSAGGNLAAALMQLLLHMHHDKPAETKNPTIKYHGKEVEVPLPAGMASLSGWFDMTRSMPSNESNKIWDYFPPANHDGKSLLPKDDIWPTSPPRGDVFCDLSLLGHPLVSPLAAKDWSGSPPMFFATGEELLTDENKLLAIGAAEKGVTVIWRQYEAMPHIFAKLLPHLENSTRCLNSIGNFARDCVEGQVESSTTWIAVETGEESNVELTKSTYLDWEYAVAIMKNTQKRRLNSYKMYNIH